MDTKRIAHAAVIRWREKQKVQKETEAGQVPVDPVAESVDSSTTDAAVSERFILQQTVSEQSRLEPSAPELSPNLVPHTESVVSQEEARTTAGVPSSFPRHGRRRRATLPQMVDMEGRLKLFSMIANKSELLREE